ncbi:MAG: DUF3801 domain-containing protein [Eubacterium sp.]|nr:DUF3801 domain-containing protein [Eubacterium sp.]
MSAEAEATDILVRISMEGAEHFLKIAGAAAERGLAFLCAALKAFYEKTRGQQKLGGKINARSFLENFTSSSIFSISKADMKVLEPELKRLHIPYMQYKTSKDMKSNGKVEISVRQEDAERFVRIAESKGIAAVDAYDFSCEEISENAYEELLNEGAAKGVDFYVTPEGVAIVNERKNPLPALTENRSVPSEQLSKASNTDDFNFDASKGIDKNLAGAKIEAARRDGRLVPISANKDTLLQKTTSDGVLLKVPGTKGKEYIFVPKGDIVNMNADGGLTIRADLRRDESYQIFSADNQPLKTMTGKEIKESNKWNKVNNAKLAAPKIPKKGGR